MNPARIALKNRMTTVLLTIVIGIAGLRAYFHLGRLENPDFVIKTALIMTPYPGASAEEVEQEVTDTLEEAIQAMGELKEIESTSRDGLSVIHAEMKDKYRGAALQQCWDKLRRKVNDAQRGLPPGAGPSFVNDDFSDVYGLFYAITGEGYSYEELKEYAEDLKKQLLLCEDVAKIAFCGVQPEVIYIETSHERMAELDISPQMIVGIVQSQNIVQPSGNVLVGDDYLRIEPTGDFRSEQRIGELLITSPATGASIRLGDIAEIRRGYQDPPRQLVRFDGRPTVGLGISTVFGGNAVTMANAVKARLKELEPQRPAGMDVDIIYDQGGTVDRAVNGFVLNLVESVAIVIVLLLIFMGVRSGLLIGSVLIVTILATFLYMQLTGICLQKISLGALILALGMLVDNAIVVVEGTLIKIQRGIDRKTAAIQTVAQTQWPLFAATVIAALAFAAIGFCPGNVGEFCNTLFWVLAVSLLLSWVTAVTVTPVLCVWFLKAPKTAVADPYGKPFYRIYRRGLHTALRFWPATLGAVAASVVAAVIGFGYVPNFFFPGSDQPLFTVDFLRPEGVHITRTSDDLRKIEAYLNEQEHVHSVATFVGQGGLRFLLSYSPEDPNPSYGQLLVTVDDATYRDAIMEDLNAFIAREYEDAEWKIKPFMNGPAYDYDIEARFRGPDEKVLHDLADQAQEIMRRFSTKNVRDNWRNRVCVLRPDFSESVARQTGLTRNDLAHVLRMSFGGQTVGVYREKDDLLPIIVRSPQEQHDRYTDASKIHAWSEVHNRAVPLDVIVADWTANSVWKDPIIERWQRQREIKAQCDPREGLASPVLAELRPFVEEIELPPGYSLAWGGEEEESAKGTEPLAVAFPVCLFAMFLILIVMFNALRQPLIIFLCLPLISVGVTASLLITGLPFGFMSILGFLGLSGMLIKNAIVLIDEIEQNRSNDVAPYQAVLDAAVSRLRPVAMASGTTVLGMTPLLWDPFYQGLAATVAGGLIGSTILVLLVVPLFYVLFFRIKPVSPTTA
jgi:multidrug efflux pump subunit AcrB